MSSHSSPIGAATLEGTYSNPMMRLRFERNARIPTHRSHYGEGRAVIDWVRALPGRRWDPQERCWFATAFSTDDPEQELAEAGFEVVIDPEHRSLRDLLTLSDLVTPLVKVSSKNPGLCLVRHRFAGFNETAEILGSAAMWDKTRGLFEIRTADLARVRDGKRVLLPGLEYLPGVKEAVKTAAVMESPVDASVSSAAATAALATGIDVTDIQQESLDKLIDHVGDVPEWFGLDLYPYQRFGAIAAAAGRYALCDDAGLGKTRQALAAAAIKDPSRVLIIVPPIVVTNWAREAEQSLLHEHVGPITVFHARKKAAELPTAGIVIVPDSLIGSRQQLLDDIIEWSPDFFIYDEAHRGRNWTSTRSKKVRSITASLKPGTPRIAMSGTPLFSSPNELAPILDMTGQLDPIFGGYTAFVERYCRKNHFGAWIPRKQRLPELQRRLHESVWVRRKKAEVLVDLPTKSRVPMYVDVDLKDFRAAHKDVITKIAEWIEDFRDKHGKLPDDSQLEGWASSQIGLISPLRKAAGLAKVPVALSKVAEWLDANKLDEPAADGSTFDRPLVVWAHHKPVIEALKQGAAEMDSIRNSDIAVIDGATSVVERGEIVDRFQAGKIGVLFCSITAAGVGVTLTRGSDTLFVESDWTPALVSQAEDRQQRIGQVHPVICTTMIAEGTLDERIQTVLARKSETLKAVLGGNASDVATSTSGQESTPTEILMDLAEQAMRQVTKKK